MFPQKFGGISHKHICNKHDDDYWNHRTIPTKVMADIKWFAGVNWVHVKQNAPLWWFPVLLATIVGFVGLMTFGWYFWANRDAFDEP